MGLAARALDLPLTAAEANEGLVPPAGVCYWLGGGKLVGAGTVFVPPSPSHTSHTPPPCCTPLQLLCTCWARAAPSSWCCSSSWPSRPLAQLSRWRCHPWSPMTCLRPTSSPMPPASRCVDAYHHAHDHCRGGSVDSDGPAVIGRAHGTYFIAETTSTLPQIE